MWGSFYMKNPIWILRIESSWCRKSKHVGSAGLMMLTMKSDNHRNSNPVSGYNQNRRISGCIQNLSWPSMSCECLVTWNMWGCISCRQEYDVDCSMLLPQGSMMLMMRTVCFQHPTSGLRVQSESENLRVYSESLLTINGSLMMCYMHNKGQSCQYIKHNDLDTRSALGL